MKRVEDQSYKLEELIVEVESWHRVIEAIINIASLSSVSLENPRWEPQFSHVVTQ
jgi:hypothetical protein